MENPLRHKGLRQFIIKTAIFIAIGISIQLFISVIFRNTQLFQSYLTIPKEFVLEQPNQRTIIINALMFGFIAFLILTYHRLVNLKSPKFKQHQYWFMLLAVLFLVTQYLFKYAVNQHTAFFLLHTTFWGVIKILINVLFIISLGFAVYSIDFIRQFVKTFKKEVVVCIIISIVFYGVMLLFQNLWLVFSSIVSGILYDVFHIFFDNVNYLPFVPSATMTEGGGPVLMLGNFSAIIGKPCSGIDSLLLFTSVYALIFILDRKKLNITRAIIAFFIGAVGMFATNILRIFLLFIIGAYISPTFAIGLFHSNVGWILFIAYFAIFWYIASKFVYKP